MSKKWAFLFVPLVAAFLASLVTLCFYVYQISTAPKGPQATVQTPPAPQGGYEEELPRMFWQERYQNATEKCTYNTHSACRKELLPSGESTEYILFSDGKLVLTRLDTAGHVIDRVGLTADEKVEYYHDSAHQWIFDAQGKVVELMARSDENPSAADVVFYDETGAQTKCECVSGTQSCCQKPEYNLKPGQNTFCALFPSQNEFCVETNNLQ